jgi:hypothetical protein
VNCQSVNCDTNLDIYFTADKILLTATCPATININFHPRLSQNKTLAFRCVTSNLRWYKLDRQHAFFRQCHYNTASKIFLVFTHEFWCNDSKINSGRFYRSAFYPAQLTKSGLGVMLASYWGTDSVRFAAMDDRDVVEEILEGIAEAHKDRNPLVKA